MIKFIIVDDKIEFQNKLKKIIRKLFLIMIKKSKLIVIKNTMLIYNKKLMINPKEKFTYSTLI